MRSKSALDNAKSSEAMKYVEELITWFEYNFSQLGKEKNQEHIEQLNAVKQALTTNNYYKTAFELINEKRVDIKLLHWAYPNCEAYNVAVREQKDSWFRKELTPEEFEFLGRLAGAK